MKVLAMTHKVREKPFALQTGTVLYSLSFLPRMGNRPQPSFDFDKHEEKSTGLTKKPIFSKISYFTGMSCGGVFSQMHS